MKQLTAKIGSKKTLNVTYQTPSETLLGTPITLPTSEPATAQVSYTVASGDLPVFSVTPASVTYIAHVVGAGKFVTAGTVYWRTKVNGTSVVTGSLAVAANNYYTATAAFHTVSVGDVVEIYLWSNQADSVYDYQEYSILYSRYNPSSKIAFYKDINFETVSNALTPTLGTPSQADTWLAGYNAISGSNYTTNRGVEVVTAITATTPVIFYGAYSSPQWGIFKSIFGETASSCSMKVHATYRPYYVPYRLIEKVSWRKVDMK